MSIEVELQPTPEVNADIGDTKYLPWPGKDGNTITIGTAVTEDGQTTPAGKNVGDIYVNNSSWDVFQWKENEEVLAWNYQGNIEGAPGAPGPQGPSGADGVSPEVTIATIAGGHSITITDAEHPSGQTFNVMDGATGATGPQGPSGADGVSPEVTIAAITGGHSITITDADHPSGQTFNVMDGATGAPGPQGPSGADGVSPEVTIATIAGGHSITITDAEHPSGQTFNVMDGTDAPVVLDGVKANGAILPIIGKKVNIPIVAKTESIKNAEIASFENGAADTPLKSAVVELNLETGVTGIKVARTCENFSNLGSVALTSADAGGARKVAILGGMYLPAGTYTLSANVTSETTGGICKAQIYADTSSSTILVANLLFASDGSRSAKTFTINQPFSCVQLMYSNGYSPNPGNAEWDYIQLELSATASDYKPFAGNIYTINFPAEAGSVTDGSVDIINGLITVGGEVYHMTPIDISVLSEGANYLWADAGTVDVTYYLDAGTAISPTISIATIPGGHSITITDAEHPSGQTFNVMDGATGPQGPSGADGVSPEVTIAAITGGHSITITDAEHPSGQTFNVMDGATGATGPQGPSGADGAPGNTINIGTAVTTEGQTTPAGTTPNDIYINKSSWDVFYWGGATWLYSGNIKGGTGSQGPQGPSGADGVSPEVTIAAITGGHSITITDAEHPSGQTFNVMDGATGPQGPQGPAGADASVTAANIESALGYAPAPKEASGTITLAAASWTGSASPYSQVVTSQISGVTAKSRIDLYPSDANLDQLETDGVKSLIAGNNNGAITVTCRGNKPSVDLTIQYARVEEA